MARARKPKASARPSPLSPPAPPARPVARLGAVLAGFWRWLAQFAAPLLLGAALLAGLLVLGRWASGALSARGAPLPFLAIACDAPPGLDRETFLAEVQYLGDLPDEIDLLDGSLAVRLAGAFSLHPWVAAVHRVEKGPGRVTARLGFRVPALAVRWAGGLRAVDEDGVLLPVGALDDGLPVLAGAPGPPPERPGTPWPDPAVRSAARTAAALLPRRAELGLDGCSVAVVGGEVTLAGRGWRARWGKPPGEEDPGEPSPAEKLERLAGRRDGLDLARPR